MLVSSLLAVIDVHSWPTFWCGTWAPAGILAAFLAHPSAVLGQDSDTSDSSYAPFSVTKAPVIPSVILTGGLHLPQNHALQQNSQWLHSGSHSGGWEHFLCWKILVDQPLSKRNSWCLLPWWALGVTLAGFHIQLLSPNGLGVALNVVFFFFFTCILQGKEITLKKEGDLI